MRTRRAAAERSIGRRAAAGAVVFLAALTGCTAEPSVAGIVPPSSDYAGVAFVDDVDFGAPQGVLLDICLPDDVEEDAPAVVSVHGGGWRQGDKAQRPWRDTCAWLASEGFVVFQPNYRLAPDHPYPAAIEDVSRAVRWARQNAQVERFGHDPERIGAFGDSAGGNLVSLLGTRGEGPRTVGTRVDAVVELSAPIDLTLAGTALGGLSSDFQRVQLDYLGCASYDDCRIAADASPVTSVDASDPPFFVAHSTDEFIPVEQAEAFVARLEEAGIEAEFVPVAGSGHALAILDDDLRERIATWLHEQLDA
ncbi:alpha/beta hydrolase [Labedella phragmitis]|uniref:alpha/beta hydrolase n=1 Tax=Labedella phragmitis TaxID=2498849 RepID=UPI00140E0745|nr:alpha/beta hydrolase [Labedella phragmitis]